MIWNVLSAVLCSIWVFALAYMRIAMKLIPLLREVASSESNRDWPLVSVIIPACNEAQHIEAALKSLLNVDYPALEVIVIDDRSTDATGEIIDRIAAEGDRVKALHVESLPRGWLGKVHALDSGVQQAGGDWYLFTDADVHFEPALLKQAVGYAQRHDLDHLACIPEIKVSNAFWLDVAIRAFFLLFSVSARLASVNRDGSRWPVGIGAFNLVEAETFRRTPGFSWLRMEPADDLGLGAMLKNAGARTHLVNGDGLLGVSWYSSVGEMVQGLEKNSFGPGANYRYSRQMAIVILLWLFALAPEFSLFAGLVFGETVLFAAGLAANLAIVVFAFVMPRRSPKECIAFLLMPVGVLIMSIIMLRSAILCWRNDGIDWRGTHYSVADLRAGQRVRF